MKLGYLGPIGSYSYEAACKYKKEEDTINEFETISKVVEELECGNIDKCIVPIENAIQGSVIDTIDSVLKYEDINIIDEIVLDIKHSFMAKTRDTRIAKIYSHPQALAQCNTYLNENYYGVERVPVSSTSYAASLAAKESGTACICNNVCKDIYNLEVINDNIQDIKDNQTKFVVFSKTKNTRETKKTSVLFTTKDEPGALYKILGIFTIGEINLTKIESRPAKTKLGEYMFFVDIDGDEKEDKVKSVLDNVSSYCNYFRIIGSY